MYFHPNFDILFPESLAQLDKEWGFHAKIDKDDYLGIQQIMMDSNAASGCQLDFVAKMWKEYSENKDYDKLDGDKKYLLSKKFFDDVELVIRSAIPPEDIADMEHSLEELKRDGGYYFAVRCHLLHKSEKRRQQSLLSFCEEEDRLCTFMDSYMYETLLECFDECIPQPTHLDQDELEIYAKW